MAHVITSPRDAIRSRISRINTKFVFVMMPYTVLIFYFMKASSAVHYLYVHTDDGGVEALLFAIKRLIAVMCVPCHKVREQSYMTLIV